MKRDRIAEALKRAAEQVKLNRCQVVQSAQLTRADREILQNSGWLEEIIRGWYMLVRPDVLPGDTTLWYANYWGFLRLYLTHRYGDSYVLSPESSLLFHTASTVVPLQVIVMIEKGGVGLVELPNGTSIYSYVERSGIPDEIEEVLGLKVMTLPLSLARVSPSFFRESQEEARIALGLVSAPETVAPPLLKYDLHTAAGRVVGGLKAVGRERDSERLQKILLKGGLKVREVNPFEEEFEPVALKSSSAIYNRIVSGFESNRVHILNLLENENISRLAQDRYLESAEKQHQVDAYHSLSIEGYHVTPELIEQVESGSWNPHEIEQHQNQRDALAARGYFEAFLQVEKSIGKIFSGVNPGTVIRDDLSVWYQALWDPCVQAGLIPYVDTLGYRKGPVYIRGSRHVPPPRESLTDAMEALFDCLEKETSPFVRAILGHYFFVLIHPYPDGNGRIARFLMNVQLASDCIPWCVITKETRSEYFSALEQSRIEQNITSFARFILRSF